jgi:hypothetical protein
VPKSDKIPQHVARQLRDPAAGLSLDRAGIIR